MKLFNKGNVTIRLVTMITTTLIHVISILSENSINLIMKTVVNLSRYTFTKWRINMCTHVYVCVY